MKKKDGRPPRSIAGWRLLHARHELEVRFPEVLALIETLERNVDPPEVDAALAKAIASLKKPRGRSREHLPANATVEQRQLHAAAEVERLSEDRQALEALTAAVNAELGIATAALSHAETNLRTVALEREPIDRYEAALAKKLRAAGITNKVARETTAEHVNRIRDALDGADADGFRVHRRPFRRPAEVALAWHPDNPWSNMPHDVEHYRLQELPMTVGGIDVVALRHCGLPPVTNLNDFGHPYLMGAFDAATDARSKAKTCWSICAKWIADNITDDFGSEHVAGMREQAWTFLFGVQYGFAHEVRKLARVSFPSPWSPDQFVIANLRG